VFWDAAQNCPERLLLLELEADPQLDLEVGDLVVLNVATNAPHLDPIKSPQRLRGSGGT
jgi:hypothetical protein